MSGILDPGLFQEVKQHLSAISFSLYPLLTVTWIFDHHDQHLRTTIRSYH